MNAQTYTATGHLDLTGNAISLDVALPNPPSRAGLMINYYNLSKRTSVEKAMMNVILCEFTFADDPGNELATPTTGNYQTTVPLASIPKAPGLAGVLDFNFADNNECLFLFFHSDDANGYDRESFFEVMEDLYLDAQKGPYVQCPAPMMKPAPIVPRGKPRAIGGVIIR